MKRVDDLFDDWARRGRAEGMEQGHKQTASTTLHAVPLKQGEQFLDLGCGNAWAAEWAHNQGANVLAVDLSPEMVARANARGLPAARGDMTQLPLQEDTVDHVWSMEAIYYAPDPDAVLQELRRVMRTGGTLHILIDHYEENQASHSWPDDVGVPMSLRSKQAWLDALHAAGFQQAAASNLTAAPGEGIEDWKVEHGTLLLQATA